MKIKSRVERVYETNYSLNFDTHSDGGYSFDCGADGKVDTSDFSPEGLKNYEKCMSGELPLFRPAYIKEWENTYMKWAVGECDNCGADVHLVPEGGHGIDCECGAIYTQLGDRCRPRSQWEEQFDDDY